MTNFWDQIISDLVNDKKPKKPKKPKKNIKVRYHLGSNMKFYLTKREYECFKLIKTGLTMKQVGAKLELSPRTVEFYLQNIKQRLGLKSMKKVIAYIDASVIKEVKV